ncbi:MAG TPA: phasin family protein [Stellaceae bacterium]|nr:phasin family protein [Stellaceae bacterium]
MPVPVPVEVAAPAPPASAAVAPPEVAPPEVAPAEDAAAALPDGTASVDDAWAAVVAAQAALARGFEEIAGEVTGMTRSGIAVTADAALALLGARTFAEAVGINAGLAGHRVEAMIEGSVKLSEIGVKAVTEASQPILSRFGAPWGTTGGTTGGATGGAPGGGAGAG